MARPRTVPPFIDAPTHGGRIVNCRTATECAIHTAGLPEGHFVALVLSNPDREDGAVAILDRDEVEAHITLLRNAIEDAERLDQGKSTVHAAHSLRRN